jgi:hypothetical protein
MDNYVPSRTCPCTRCKANDMLAPALLVAFGLLLLMNNLQVVGFGRTWPLLLIVVGGVRVLQSTASTLGHLLPGDEGDAFTAVTSDGGADAAKVSHE